MQNQFDIMERKQVYYVATAACILHWIIGVFEVFSNLSAELNMLVLPAMQLGSAIFSLTVYVIVCKFFPRLAGFLLFWLACVRIAMTFLLFHMTSKGVEGFELIDPKELHDSIPLITMPFLITAACNWRFNILFSVPLVLISTILATQQAYKAEDDNMACYKQGDLYAGKMSSRGMIQEAIMIFAGYLLRTVMIERFIEEKQAQKQQQQLQNLFDN